MADKENNNPTLNGSERDAQGRFLPGNKGGPGNPHSKKTQQLKTAMLAAVGKKDIKRILKRMLKMAAGGDVQAAKLVLDRCFGKPLTSVDVVQGEIAAHESVDYREIDYSPETPEEVAEEEAAEKATR